MNFIELIGANYNLFSRSEKKVADVVLNDPHTAISLSIASLAKLANVSEPSVHRFCQKMNTKGYPDFKLHLAQSIAKGTTFSNLHVDENDSTENFSKKIFDASISTLNEARKSLDISKVKKCIDVLSCAKRLTFCGLGASATVAHDMMNKFFYFNIPCNYFEDSVMMLTSASNANIDDVFILISRSGITKELIEVAKLARARAATVIGLTPSNSPLASECSIVLSMQTPDDMDVYMPTATRLAQLTLVDILVTGLTLRRGPQFIASIKKLKEVIRSTRINLGDHTQPKPALSHVVAN